MFFQGPWKGLVSTPNSPIAWLAFGAFRKYVPFLELAPFFRLKGNHKEPTLVLGYPNSVSQIQKGSTLERVHWRSKIALGTERENRGRLTANSGFVKGLREGSFCTPTRDSGKAGKPAFMALYDIQRAKPRQHVSWQKRGFWIHPKLTVCCVTTSRYDYDSG